MTKSIQLQLIHSIEALENGIARFSLVFGAKKNGRILNGNVRCKILIERGIDINGWKERWLNEHERSNRIFRWFVR